MQRIADGKGHSAIRRQHMRGVRAVELDAFQYATVILERRRSAAEPHCSSLETRGQILPLEASRKIPHADEVAHWRILEVRGALDQ